MYVTFQAGSAEADITPDVSIPLVGPERSTGVHDPLSAKALVLSDAAATIGIVSADILYFPYDMARKVREEAISEGFDDVILTATHTHTAPCLESYSTKMITSGSDAISDDYIAELRESVVESLREANDNKTSATMWVGSAQNETASLNRRNTVPSDKIDATLSVADIETDSGDETLLFNFPCHPVCVQWKSDLSADWPGIVYQGISDELDATTIFINGAAGDINPRGYDSDNVTYSNMREVGENVLETVLTARNNARKQPNMVDSPLMSDRCELRLPVKSTPPRQQLDQELENIERDLERCDDHRVNRYVRNEKKRISNLLDLSDWQSEHIPATLQYLEIGRLGLLTVPGEPFVEHGLYFRESAPTSEFMVAGYANGNIGYVPTLEDLEYGGYEVWKCQISPEGIMNLRDAAEDLME